MAKIEQIPILGRMRGRVGDLVVRRYRDKYVVAARPYTEKPRSARQKAQSQRFADAMAYARNATRDPPTKELYDQAVKDLDRASNTVAVSDYLRPPVIDQVDLGDYSGQKGTRLTVRVENVVAARQVAVFILDGATAEEVEDPAGDDGGPAGEEADTATGDDDGEDGKPRFTGFAEAAYHRWLSDRALELGLASRNEGEDGEWSYTTKTDAGTSRDEGLIVVVRVEDHPGNEVEERVEVALHE